MSSGCGIDGPELDQILIPGSGDAYETHQLLTLLGLGRGTLKSLSLIHISEPTRPY